MHRIVVVRRGLAALAAVLLTLVFAPACGKRRAARSHGEPAAAEAPVPTPDNTPIDVLRTPAGLVLKTEEPTPAREATPAPVSTPAPGTPSAAPKTTP